MDAEYVDEMIDPLDLRAFTLNHVKVMERSLAEQLSNHINASLSELAPEVFNSIQPYRWGDTEGQGETDIHLRERYTPSEEYITGFTVWVGKTKKIYEVEALRGSRLWQIYDSYVRVVLALKALNNLHMVNHTTGKINAPRGITHLTEADKKAI